jgi:enolase-phosphatase E1
MNQGVRHILLDIEGTTCPVSFVTNVLFPYARERLVDYLVRHDQKPDMQQLLGELQKAWQQEQHPEARELLLAAPLSAADTTGENTTSSGAAAAVVSGQALVPYLHWLIRQDRKLTAWKDLQGRIWEEGYARGDLKADLFDDVLPALRRWKQSGLELSVYSSGSVAAQQLLYGHSLDGDVRDLFSHWFDTRIGIKQEVESYQRILETLGCMADEVLFISDAIGELQAAEAAGMQVAFSDRDGNPERDPGRFPSINRLDQLVLA